MNKDREAYTGNTAGRRGDVPPQSNSASSEHHAVGDGVNVSEASTEESNGEIPEGLPGSESVACSERSVRNLGDPSTSSGLLARGRTVQSQKGCPTGERSEGSQIIS